MNVTNRRNSTDADTPTTQSTQQQQQQQHQHQHQHHQSSLIAYVSCRQSATATATTTTSSRTRQEQLQQFQQRAQQHQRYHQQQQEENDDQEQVVTSTSSDCLLPLAAEGEGEEVTLELEALITSPARITSSTNNYDILTYNSDSLSLEEMVMPSTSENSRLDREGTTSLKSIHHHSINNTRILKSTKGDMVARDTTLVTVSESGGGSGGAGIDGGGGGSGDGGGGIGGVAQERLNDLNQYASTSNNLDVVNENHKIILKLPKPSSVTESQQNSYMDDDLRKVEPLKINLHNAHLTSHHTPKITIKPIVKDPSEIMMSSEECSSSAEDEIVSKLNASEPHIVPKLTIRAKNEEHSTIVPKLTIKISDSNNANSDVHNTQPAANTPPLPKLTIKTGQDGHSESIITNISPASSTTSSSSSSLASSSSCSTSTSSLMATNSSSANIISKLTIKPLQKSHDNVNNDHPSIPKLCIKGNMICGESIAEDASTSKIPKLTIKTGQEHAVIITQHNDHTNASGGIPKLTIKTKSLDLVEDSMNSNTSGAENAPNEKIPKITIKTNSMDSTNIVLPKRSIKTQLDASPLSPKQAVPKLTITRQQNDMVVTNKHTITEEESGTIPKMTIKTLSKSESVPKLTIKNITSGQQQRQPIMEESGISDDADEEIEGSGVVSNSVMVQHCKTVPKLTIKNLGSPQQKLTVVQELPADVNQATFATGSTAAVALMNSNIAVSPPIDTDEFTDLLTVDNGGGESSNSQEFCGFNDSIADTASKVLSNDMDAHDNDLEMRRNSDDMDIDDDLQAEHEPQIFQNVLNFKNQGQELPELLNGKIRHPKVAQIIDTVDLTSSPSRSCSPEHFVFNEESNSATLSNTGTTANTLTIPSTNILLERLQRETTVIQNTQQMKLQQQLPQQVENNSTIPPPLQPKPNAIQSSPPASLKYPQLAERLMANGTSPNASNIHNMPSKNISTKEENIIDSIEILDTPEGSPRNSLDECPEKLKVINDRASVLLPNGLHYPKDSEVFSHNNNNSNLKRHALETHLAGQTNHTRENNIETILPSKQRKLNNDSINTKNSQLIVNSNNDLLNQKVLTNSLEELNNAATMVQQQQQQQQHHQQLQQHQQQHLQQQQLQHQQLQKQQMQQMQHMQQMQQMQQLQQQQLQQQQVQKLQQQQLQQQQQQQIQQQQLQQQHLQQQSTDLNCLKQTTATPVVPITSHHRARKQKHDNLIPIAMEEVVESMQMNSNDSFDLHGNNNSTEQTNENVTPVIKRRGRPKKNIATTITNANNEVHSVTSQLTKPAQKEEALQTDLASKSRRVQLLRKRLAIDMIDADEPVRVLDELESSVKAISSGANEDRSEIIEMDGQKKERNLRTPLRTSRRSNTPTTTQLDMKTKVRGPSSLAMDNSNKKQSSLLKQNNENSLNHFLESNSSISSASSNSSSTVTSTIAPLTSTPHSLSMSSQIDLTMSSSSSNSNGSTINTITTVEAALSKQDPMMIGSTTAGIVVGSGSTVCSGGGGGSSNNSMLPPTTILSSDPLPDVIFKSNDFSSIMATQQLRAPMMMNAETIQNESHEVDVPDEVSGADNSGDDSASSSSISNTIRRGRGRGRGSRGGRGRGYRAHRLGRNASAVSKAIAMNRPRCVGALKHTPDPDRIKGLYSPSPSVFEEDTRMSADLTQNNSQPEPTQPPHTPQTPTRQPDFLNIEESQSSVISSNSLLDPNNVAATQNGSTAKKPVKRKKMEVCVAEDADITVASIAEYDWPPPKGCCPSKNRDTFMIQEQVALYLGIKSFKRKYPDLPRRQIDMEERNYLQEKSLVSEKMCDLGITAVWASDILDIMYTDFYDKYEEYKDFVRQKHLREIEAKQKSLGLNVAGRGLQARERAMLSTSKWNAYLNRTRKEERLSCLDLQTLTVNKPSPASAPIAAIPNRPVAEAVMKAAKAEKIPEPPTLLKLRVWDPIRPRDAYYPLSLVPGQFCEKYYDYSPQELQQFPLNTLLDRPSYLCTPKEESTDTDSAAETIDFNDGSKSSNISACERLNKQRRIRRIRAKHARKLSNAEFKVPPPPGATSSSSTDTYSSSEDSSSDTDSDSSCTSSSSDDSSDSEITPATCGVCQHSQNRNLRDMPELFVQCYTCRRKVHPSCIEMPHRMATRVRNYNWQCADCKCCIKCKRKQDENKMLFCEQCDRGFHIYCLSIKAVPDGRWSCDRCSICMRCGATKPEGLPIAQPNGDKLKVKHRKLKWINEYRIDHITKLREHSSMLCVPCGRAKSMKRVQINTHNNTTNTYSVTSPSSSSSLSPNSNQQSPTSITSSASSSSSSTTTTTTTTAAASNVTLPQISPVSTTTTTTIIATATTATNALNTGATTLVSNMSTSTSSSPATTAPITKSFESKDSISLKTNPLSSVINTTTSEITPTQTTQAINSTNTFDDTASLNVANTLATTTTATTPTETSAATTNTTAGGGPPPVVA